MKQEKPEANKWKTLPFVKALCTRKPIMWHQPDRLLSFDYPTSQGFAQEELEAARKRLERFAPYFEKAFPITQLTKGIIESELLKIDHFKKDVSQSKFIAEGNLWLKCDSHLPISGSIKARGGIYEVLKYAETLAIEAGKLDIRDSYEKLYTEEMKTFFSKYTVAVGSTGNLGLSIGMISSKLGFQVKVHMSSDAKAWKKNMLRANGVEVIEYDSDYSVAVETGRKASENDPMSYFVDDEHSKDLFLGYTVAGKRLKNQLDLLGVEISKERPLIVYLPCGVGGGPGGVGYGLKEIYKDNVYIYFVEPVESPCMFLGISTKTYDQYSVSDIGLSNQTLADGLAVGRASKMVAKLFERRIDGLATVEDHMLLKWLKLMYETEEIKLEPSALAGVAGFLALENNLLLHEMEGHYNVPTLTKEQFLKGHHIIWATGGSMVPEEDFEAWLEKA